MEVIFLDFDGVLNSAKYLLGREDYGVVIDPARMRLLKQIVAATGAKIVLSTSWREHWSKNAGECDSTGVLINSIFDEYGLQVYDKTPELHARRETEIKNWLDRHPEVKGLEKAGFDKDNEDHLLICCGDYFDRGNENVEVLRFFERLQRKVLLRGNHEDMLLKLLQTGKVLPHHYINGTMRTLENFFGKYSIDLVDDTIDFSGKSRITDRICEFIEETVDYCETEHYVFVHGWLPENALTPEARKAASPEAWEKARWVKWNERYVGLRPLADKTLVCGHVPAFYANALDPSRGKNCCDVFRGNGLIVIDAGTADTKQVNVLVLEDKG